MSNFNKVILCGNLTRDPELRYTPKGTAVAKFGLAINRKYKTDSGDLKEEATFVDIDTFGKTAELAGQYLKRGRSVLVEGRLKTSVWEDKQTEQKRSKLGVIGDHIIFMGAKPAGSEAQSPATAAETPNPSSPTEDDSADNQVPF